MNSKKKIFIVAEIGNNHEGNIRNAKKLIYNAKLSGADAVKFQIFKPDLFVHKDQIQRINILKKFQLTYSQFLSLKKYSDKLRIKFFASAFDLESLNFIMKHTNIIKVASSDNNNFIFLEKILKNKKKCIISTGLLNFKQIEALVTTLKKRYSKRFLQNNLCLLHCISSYPAKDNNMNLNFISQMKKRYKLPVGFSDHSIGIEAPIVAASLGAKVIEKHYTLDNNFSNFRDHKISLNPFDFKKMVQSIRRVENMTGKDLKFSIKDELLNETTLRRTFYASKRISKGEKFSLSNLIALRPKVKNSVDLDNIKKFLDKKAKKNYKKDQPILI
tara:strand:+ start:10102 stop:11091 length:990 start_codon:yes stop_codon:yes gene_type:complete